LVLNRFLDYNGIATGGNEKLAAVFDLPSRRCRPRMDVLLFLAATRLTEMIRERILRMDWPFRPIRMATLSEEDAAMGMPAARVGDMHVCPMVTVLVPHVGGPVLPPGGIPVLIGGMPAARVGDMAVCVGPPDVIALGSFTVLIGGMPAARLGDMTAHGGALVMGCPTVLIG
jgi:uncharacterized Zn-binding protein involved in type VI secretion